MFTVCSEDEENSPWPIFRRILKSHSELEKLDGMMEAGTSLAFMLRLDERVRQGRRILGTCYCKPSAQGDLRPLFEQLLEDTLGYYPDFLIILDGLWWADATAQQREILVFHEVLHADQAEDKHGSPRFDRQTGLPVPCIRGHDLEEFHAVVERYGAWAPDIVEFASALERFRTGEGTPEVGVGPVF